MDLNVYLIGIVIVLMLTLFGLLKNDLEWAVFPGMAAVIGTYFTLSVFADGSLTQVSGSSPVVIASASLDATSAWQFISLIPMVFTFMAGLIATYKVAKGI